MRKILLALCDELSKRKPDREKVNRLLKQAKITPSDDPMEITNEVLKQLHSYEEISDAPMHSLDAKQTSDEEQTF